MCASQEVCPDVIKSLSELGFVLLKETPNSPDSDLVMVSDIEKKDIQAKGEQILKSCGVKVQQVLVSVI